MIYTDMAGLHPWYSLVPGASAIGCWSLDQSGMPPDSVHTHADSCFSLAQPGPPTAPAFTFNSGGSSQSSHTRAVYNTGSFMCITLDPSTQPGMTCPQSQILLAGVVAQSSQVQSTPCPGFLRASGCCGLAQPGLSPDPDHKNADGYCSLAWPDLPLALALASPQRELQPSRGIPQVSPRSHTYWRCCSLAPTSPLSA